MQKLCSIAKCKEQCQKVPKWNFYIWVGNTSDAQDNPPLKKQRKDTDTVNMHDKM